MSIIIVGCGMTGSILALAISHFSHNTIPIYIIEKKSINKIDFNQTVALSTVTCQKLLKINLWKIIKKYANPIKKIFVHEKNSFGSLIFNEKDYIFTSLGYVIELKKIKEKIFFLLKNKKNINFFSPNNIKDIINNNNNNITIILNNDKIINGKLLVISAGFNTNKISNILKIKYKIKLYKHFATTAQVISKLPNHNYAFEYFTKDGLIAFLPISQYKNAIVWCLPLSKKNQINEWNDQYFLYQLQKYFGWKLGAFIKVKKRKQYPLILKSANNIIFNRIVLTGNAAQTLHPIAAQGLNIGIRDVITLSKTIVKAHLFKNDFGNIAVLKNYEYQRQLDRKLTIKITDGLINLFSSKKLPIIISRNIGLNIIDSNKFLKTLFLKKMMGFF